MEKAQELVSMLNKKYPTLNATVCINEFCGRIEIEVSTVNKAKVLNEMYRGFNFTSGSYK